MSYSQQQLNVFGEGDIAGIVSSENSIPFWFHRNISTRIGEYTNGAAYGKAGAKFEWGKSKPDRNCFKSNPIRNCNCASLNGQLARDTLPRRVSSLTSVHNRHPTI